MLNNLIFTDIKYKSMKKLFLLATAALLVTGVSFAGDQQKKCCKKGDKKCCKKGDKKCCKDKAKAKTAQM